MLPIFMLATILALSAMDYEHLARTIQVEAAREPWMSIVWQSLFSIV